MDEVWEEFNRVLRIEEAWVTGVSADIKVTINRETKQILETTGTTSFIVEASQGDNIPKTIDNNINDENVNQLLSMIWR